MSPYEWVTVGLTVLSMAGAGISWWRSHLSATAKSDAEQTATIAGLALQALQAQAEALGTIAGAKQTPSPQISAVHLRNKVWSLVNTSDKTLTIAEVSNADAWLRVDLGDDGKLPITLEPKESTRALLLPSWGRTGQGHLSLKLSDGTDLKVNLPELP